VPSLAPGASSSAATSLVLPAGTAPGSYYVIAKADGDLAVPETQEANNLALAALQVGADLVISSVAAPSTAGAGLSISVSDTTRNAGAAEAAASVTRFYLSVDVAIDASDTLLGSRAGTGAGGRGQQQRLDAARDPCGHAARPALRDRAGGRRGRAGRDLGAQQRQLRVRPGRSRSRRAVADGARHGGERGARSWSPTRRSTRARARRQATTTKFYLSSNVNLDGTDVLLGSRAIPALAGGVNSSAATSLVLPAGTAPGRTSSWRRPMLTASSPRRPKATTWPRRRY
jgi:hypothetical protein